MKNKLLMLICTFFIAQNVLADDEKIKKSLEKFKLTNIEISDGPINGLRTIVSDQGIFYGDENGEFFLQGHLIKVTEKGVEDWTNKPLVGILKNEQKNMLEFKAENEKYSINVFTDYTCPYCVKLHKEIDKYNKLGITVRYAEFPRAGGKSTIARKMETIWNSENYRAVFDIAADGTEPKPAKTSDKVAKQYRLGVQFGVTGTPAWVTDDGTVIVGYRSPEDLLKILEVKNAAAPAEDAEKEESANQVAVPVESVGELDDELKKSLEEALAKAKAEEKENKKEDDKNKEEK